MKQKRKPGWIGVDVGTHTIKLAQVEQRLSRLQVIDAVVFQRLGASSAHVRTSGVPDDGELSTALALCEKLRGRDAASLVPSEAAEVRTMFVPEASESERRCMIDSEVRSSSNLPHDTVLDYWEWEPTGGGASEQEENVGVVCASMPVATQSAQEVEAAGLRCNVLDVPALAMARAVKIADPLETQPVAAVDWGYANTTFCVVQGGQTLFTRRVRDCSVQQIVRSLQAALDVSPDEAKHLLATRGLPLSNGMDRELQEVQRLIAEATAEPLNEFVDQLGRTLTYFEVQRRNLAPEKIWLFGGGATIANVTPYLNRELEIPVSPWGLPGEKPHGDRSHLPMLGLAIALSTLAWEPR